MSEHESQQQSVSMAILATDVGYIKKSIEGIEKEMQMSRESYARKVDLEVMEKDHESRIRRLETWGFAAVGALAVIQFALNYFK